MANNPTGKGLKPFVKGDPRINYKGRPKVLPLQKALMQALLGHTKEEDMSKSEIAQVVTALIKEAKTGMNKVAAAKELMERAWGKVKVMEEEEGSGKGGIVWNEVKTYAKQEEPKPVKVFKIKKKKK